MPPAIIAAAIAGGAGIGSSLINRSAARTQPTSSTSTQTISPTEDPAFSPLKNALLQVSQKNLTAPLPAGIEETGIRNINETFNLLGQNLESKLASSGLAGSPMAGNALTKLEIGRGGEIGKFRAGLPALERKYQDDALRQAMAFYAMQPRGRTVTGAAEGTTTYPGSALGSGINDAGSMLAFLYGMGMFDKQQPQVPQTYRI